MEPPNGNRITGSRSGRRKMSLSAALMALVMNSVPAQTVMAHEAVMAQQPVVQAAQAVQQPELEVDESLDPGEFVWQPELSTAGPVEVVVSIPQQIAYIYRGGTLIGVSTVSTGRRGHRTPTGRYPITQKRAEHYSNLYNNAPMPFMQRLTNDGIALHAGQIPGYPASHGCVRLPLAMARNLFRVTAVGTVVHILDASPTAQTALRLARGEPVAPAAPVAPVTAPLIVASSAP
jgi:lipoprotein-anchoring transpeptidase ErfK/SrfK